MLAPRRRHLNRAAAGTRSAAAINLQTVSKPLTL
jgi:hypothetical protein